MQPYKHYYCYLKGHHRLGKTVVRATSKAEARAIFCRLEKLPVSSLVIVENANK